jgi:phosphatidylglycerol:prolipoprotein diacylglycerol transferase
VAYDARMIAAFVHRIDPVLGEVGGVYLWWYGLGYALGFFEVFLWLRRARDRLGLSLRAVYDLSILFAVGVLVCGRAVEVIFYEWPYYRAHPGQIPWCWLGGMATHGLLLGATLGTWLFCRIRRMSFLRVADELVIPGAFLMGVGRIGNFIDGQIIGSETSVPWAVKFPDADGFRHPVVLYDGVKNLLLIPLLLWVRQRSKPAPGRVLAHFVFWYGFLRIFVDVFRRYPSRMFGMGTGQGLNILMSLLGLALWWWVNGRPGAPVPVPTPVGSSSPTGGTLWARRVMFALLLLFSLTLPSDWTQDIPARYGKRHPGLHHSTLYPKISQ